MRESMWLQLEETVVRTWTTLTMHLTAIVETVEQLSWVLAQ